jgi:hypothetical protein
MKQLKPWLLLAGAALALSACGGGGGGDTPPAQQDPLSALPAEATQSASAWVGFLDRLTKAAGADTREGFEVSATGVTNVPGDDVGDPAALTP